MQRAVRRARDFRERRNGPSRRGRVPRWRSGRPRVGAGDRGRWDESCQGSGAPPAGRRRSRDSGGDGVTERPLAGRTILVVASEERAEAIATALRRAGALRLELRTRPPRIAAVGPATKAVAESEGLAVDAMPDEFRTDAIADVLGPLPGRRVLLLRSSLARRALAD